MAKQTGMALAFMIGLLLYPVLGQPGDQVGLAPENQQLSLPRTVYIDASISTWRSRGRVSFPLVPSLRRKLAAAGFTVVQKETDAHDLVLKVDYREEQGKEIRFNLYGTEITCAVRLELLQGGTIMDLTIRESPPDDRSVTAPYTDVVYKLETDPYYYFLGEIAKGQVVSGLDTTGALLAAFTQLIERHEPEYGSMKGTPPNPGDTLPPPEELYVREVRAGTIRELARLNDERAIPVLIKLLDHPEWLVRRHTVEALGTMRAQGSRAAIEHAAEHDAHQSVREAAKVALANLQRL